MERSRITLGVLSRAYLLLPRRRLERAFDLADGAAQSERRDRAVRIGVGSLEGVAPTVGPPANLGDVSGRVEMVVDHVGVGDKQP